MAFYELRQYKVLPGKMNEWLNLMESEIIPFQISKGMVITGSYKVKKMKVYIFGCVDLKMKKIERNFMKLYMKVSIGKML